jgi:hypothetical protein
MTEGLFDRYFRLLAGRLPSAEYGVIADPIDETLPAPRGAGTESPNVECLC